MSVKYIQGEKDDHMYLEKFQREMLGENELWPLVTNGFSNPYHLNESTFRGIRRFFFYL